MTANPSPGVSLLRLLLWKSLKRLRRFWRTATSNWLGPRGHLPRHWDKRFARVVGTDDWGKHIRTRRSSWFWSDDDWQEIAEWVSAERPELAAAARKYADAAVARRIDILGHGPRTIPSEYDWVTDPISGQHWTHCRAEKVPIVLDDTASDIKHIWEIARFGFAPQLGAAYRLTGEEQYARSLRRWIEEFIRLNPYGHGPHWTNPMEAAIRALNWMVGWSMCMRSKHFDTAISHQLIGALIVHGRFIAANLERTYRGINTNHYIADLVGLYAIAAFVPEWTEARRWKELALRELSAEAAVQILPDGFCYESSFGYHRLTFEMWFFFRRLAVQQGDDTGSLTDDVLRSMAEFSLANADAHGHLPTFGDGDDGRFLFWTPLHRDDHTVVWNLAEAVHGPLDIPHPESEEAGVCVETLWLMGIDAFRRVETQRCAVEIGRIPGTNRRSTLFASAQTAILRSNRWLVHAFANPVGAGGVGGHKHNDMLSFTASCDGTPVIIDPGTFAYTADPSLRNSFRRTASHATLIVDGAEQNRFAPGQLFFLKKDAASAIIGFEDSDARTRLLMCHDGYRRLPSPVILSRAIILERTTEELVVTDMLSGIGDHHVEVVFPLGDVDVCIKDAQTVGLHRDGAEVATLTIDGGHQWQVNAVPGWASSAYGSKYAHKRLVFSVNCALPCTWNTTLTPVHTEQPAGAGT